MGVDIETYRAKIGSYRHASGVVVITLVCVINFSKGLKTVGCVLFIGTLLIIGGVEQNPGPRESDPQVTETTPKTYCKVKVTGVSDNVDDNSLKLFFEEQGCSDIKAVTLSREKQTAIIECEDTEAMNTALQQQSFSIQGATITLERFAESKTGERSEIPESQTFDQDNIRQSEEIEKRTWAEAKQRGDVDSSGKSIDTVDHKEHEAGSHSVDRRGADYKSDISHSEIDLKESEGQLFREVLLKLGLENKYPGRISIQDVIAVDPNEANNQEKKCCALADVPWVMLRRLICAHSEARDITASEDKNKENEIDLDCAMSFLSESHEETENISPLDIFAIVFQCCDPLMKQIFVQKLYLCKLAVPFLYQFWGMKECHPTIYVWPLCLLSIENRLQSGNTQTVRRDVDPLELETKVLAFARIGRPRYSKSKLLNNLLADKGCNTFYNIDSPSGMNPRSLHNGNVEMFWLPTVGDKKDRFQDAITFLNMRGDLNGDFDKTVQVFIANFVDAVIIIVDREMLMKRRKDTESIIVNFSSVILVIADPLTTDLIRQIGDFERMVTTLKKDMKLRIISTHKGVVEKNIIDMVSYISKHISSHLKSSRAKSFEERLSDSRTQTLKTDEQEKNCREGKKEAEKLFQQMKQDGESRQWKYLLTPVHSKYSQTLGRLMKKSEREDMEAKKQINSEIQRVLHKQTHSITKTVKSFIDILIGTGKTTMQLQLFLTWLHFYIEREKRKNLPDLMDEHRREWEKLKTLNSKETKDASEIGKQENVITGLEKKLDDASFSLDHFFREIGHIYEAVINLNETPSKFDLPPVKEIAKIIGKLFADGQKLELIDGESFYMPYLWIKSVLEHLDQTVSSRKVMSLSVLGLQSSGKSTLLNTMFGCQFSTRTGRCTRGINLKLIPVKTECSGSTVLPFSCVLVVDTEGLRPPELSHNQHEHDNELATVITGIGDITLLNIMGENTSEIRDILQVIVHAFIRLKMVNYELDIRKSCAFIHQNVTDSSASENMLSGLSTLMQTLDEMTKESARSEGILEINRFNQIIEFDINSQVWYLKNLWQGNPPMASVNNEYSEKVVDIKCKIIEKAMKMENKSYKSLEDVIVHAHSLWKGVLKENFVFSFRNRLEIRTYMELEKNVQDELWQLETFVRDSLISTVQNEFASCVQAAGLRHIADVCIERLRERLADKKTETETVIRKFFENHKYKDIMIHWIEGQYRLIADFSEKLKRNISEEVEKCLQKRSLEILTVADHETHEEELRTSSMKVANEHKGKELTEEEKDTLFAEIWVSFFKKVESSLSHVENRKKMHEVFLTYLKTFFVKDHALLKESLENTKYLQPINYLEKLTDSFKLTGITKNDISYTPWQNGNEILSRKTTLKLIKGRVNQIFEAMDETIIRLCQVNNEITELIVHRVMHDLDDSIKGISTETTDCDFKKSFYVKLYIHVSRFAHPVFEQHNEEYFKTQGVAVRLEQYRKQQLISFKGHLDNRKSEDTAAKLFSDVIETFAEEWTSDKLPNKVADYLYSALPSVKNRVIVEIYTDLINKGNFDDFIKYLRSPEDYASKWLTERANSHLFAGEYPAYASFASSLLTTVYREVRDSLNDLKRCYSKISPPSMEKWITDFQEKMKERHTVIEPERFRSVKSEVKQIQNVEYFINRVLANLLLSEEKVQIKFSQATRKTVRWNDSNPIERISKKIWGCPKKCAFCGEPCAKNEGHVDSVHYSLQHRPFCCNGVHIRETNQAVLESCESVIQSRDKHACAVFGFICNEGIKKTCGKEHLYRDFKEYMPDWDIKPTSNMANTSIFWKWFVATYKKDLHLLYGYFVNNVPDSWGSITKTQAKESLDKTYAALNCESRHQF